MIIQENAHESKSHYSDRLISSPYEKELEKAKRFARFEEIAILILGETGTGKTRLARAIHDSSPRKLFPFVEIDCASISPSLVESELFGHQRGAFTGATQDRPGRVRSAHLGTLFLDEIGELDISIQAKLLRLLEEKVIVPVGSEKTIPVNLRIIAATNRNLENMIQTGSFRRDLFERIRQAMLSIPPLRERRDSIVPLVQMILEEWRQAKGEAKFLSPDAQKLLEDYSWPGNIRELKNAMRYACAISSDASIQPDHLPETIRFIDVDGPCCESGIPDLPDEGMDLRKHLLDIEWSYFQAALIRSDGNSEKAAGFLGISGHAFRKALRERFCKKFAEMKLAF
jgi:two-component system response regulator PilR (NtrC family)